MIDTIRYYKMGLEYDGTSYLGWQTQKKGRTIQDVIRREIEGITGESVRLTGAGRTDAGVHALEQVAGFSTLSKLGCDVLKRALNARLPQDIRVSWIEETDGNFHPRYSAAKKRYFYILSTRTAASASSAFLFKYMWDVHADIDIGAMRQAAGFLVGRHDFSSFRGAGCGAKTTTRTVYCVDISAGAEITFMTCSAKGFFIKIIIEADAFLRHMARNIVGTLVEVGRNRIAPGNVREIIEAGDRRAAGPTAPARGLFMEKVIY
jgi:tRNA pseudouridine38-40 synthase